MKNELKRIQKVLSPDYAEYLAIQRKDDEEKNIITESFLKITLDFLKKMKQEDLANHLQRSRRFSLKI